MTSQSSGNESLPISKEEHFKDLVYYVIQLIEVAYNKHAGDMFVRELKLLLDAANCLRDIREGKDLESNEEKLESLGGEALFREIAFEVREWIFIYEAQDIRRFKKRGEKKMDTQQDPMYLQEAYSEIQDLFKRSSIGMIRQIPSLKREEVSLGMLRDYLMTGKCEKPIVSPDVLADRYRKDFEYFEQHSREIHEKLGMFKNQVSYIDLYTINEWGVSGIREQWREDNLLMERVNLEYIGVPRQESRVFKETFTKRVRKSKESGSGEEAHLQAYIRFINEFLCRLISSPDNGGVPEMQMALDVYLQDNA